MSYSAEENRAYLKNRYAAQRSEFIIHLGGECAECGETEDLHIDHVDPLLKSFAIGKLWAEKDLPKVYQELEKCQLLCAWCHKDKTRKEARLELGFTHGTLYGWMKKKCTCEKCQAAKDAWHSERNRKRRLYNS